MGLMENIKDTVSLVGKIDNIELYRQTLDIQKDAIELIEDNKRLKEEIEDLKDKFIIKESIEYQNNAYWINNGDNKVDGPFCTKCWDDERKLIRFIKERTSKSTCPKCRIEIRNPIYGEEQELLINK